MVFKMTTKQKNILSNLKIALLFMLLVSYIGINATIITTVISVIIIIIAMGIGYILLKNEKFHALLTEKNTYIAYIVISSAAVLILVAMYIYKFIQ